MCAAARRRRRRQRRRRRSRGLIDGLVCQCGGALLPARDVEGEGGRRRDRASRPSRPLPTRPRCARRSAPRLSCRLDDRAGRAGNSSSAAAIKRPPTTRRRVTSMSRAGVGAAPSSYAMYHQVHQQSFQVSPRRSSAAVRPSVCLRSRRRRPRPPRTFIHIPMRPRHSICGASHARRRRAPHK